MLNRESSKIELVLEDVMTELEENKMTNNIIEKKVEQNQNVTNTSEFLDQVNNFMSKSNKINISSPIPFSLEPNKNIFNNKK